MVRFSKISPMVRAIGTMGAVAALVGAVTFAQLTSNTVALSPNTLSTATASLAIGSGTSCPGGATTGSVPGFNNVKLTPGVTSAQLPFCLENNGDIPLDLTVAIPQSAFTGDTGVPPSAVTLDITCANGGHSSGTLDQYTGGTPLGSLSNAGGSNITNCNATATLSSSFTGSGQNVPSFDIDFTGTQSSAT
jgi:hypothetical protein